MLIAHAGALFKRRAVAMIQAVLIAVMAALTDTAVMTWITKSRGESLQDAVTELSADMQGCTTIEPMSREHDRDKYSALWLRRARLI